MRRPRTDHWVMSVLTDIYLGDERVLPRGRGESARPGHLSAAEDGKITLVTVVAVLALVVLIGLVGNTGQVVVEKIEVQNAADAAAYSSTLWMARGMNAITTTNHLMGEATALVVILDSFGGAMSYKGGSVSTKENDAFNRQIDDLDDKTSPKLATFSKIPLEVDAKIVKAVAELLMADKNGGLKVGAALYDAQLTLKFVMVIALRVKGICARITEVTYPIVYPPIGPLIEGGCAIVQALMSGVIAEIAKEWALLKGVEYGVGSIWTENSTRKGVVTYLPRALSIYGDTVAGQLGGSGRQKKTAMNNAVRDTLDMLKEEHGVTELVTYPNWEDLRLPIEREEPPFSEEQQREQEEGTETEDLGEWDIPPSLWSGNDMHPDLRNALKIVNEVGKPIAVISDWFGFIKKWLRWARKLPKLPGKFNDMLRTFNILGDAMDIADSLDQISAFGAISELNNTLNKGYPENPSHNPKGNKKYRLREFYWEVEQKSQWVRATYPYVDSFRAPIRGFFRDNCPLSNASTYYINWTNRYTLAVSWEVRKKNDSDKKKQDDDDPRKMARDLIQELRELIEEFRAKLEEALDATGAIDDGIEFVENPYEVISKEFVDRIHDYTDDITGIDAIDREIQAWIQEVLDHPKFMTATKADAATIYDAELGMDEHGFVEFTEDIRRVIELDRLLQLLLDALDAAEDFLNLLQLGPPHMYVMRDSTPDSKGKEDWTADSADGRLMAERRFTLIAFARREPTASPLQLDGVFDNPTANGTSTYAQSLVYNANGRSDEISAGPTQPDTGWDTLNWRREPAIAAPEWGDHIPSGGGEDSMFSLFRGSLSATDTAKVKLNWQAKLVPVTLSRLNAVLSKEDFSEAIKEAARSGSEHSALLTH